MDFSLNGESLFCAPIHSDNRAVLSFSSQPLSESANLGSGNKASISKVGLMLLECDKTLYYVSIFVL